MSVLKRYTGGAWEPVGGAEAPPITIAYAQVTANQTGITAEADLTGLSVTFTADGSRRYKITAHVLAQQLTSTGAATGKITDAANVEYQRFGHNAAFLANGVEVWHGSRVISGLSGSQTFKLRGATSAGTLSALADATRPNFILVEDITGGSGALSVPVRGRLGYAQATSNQGSITSAIDLTGLSVTVTVNSGERIKITGQYLFINDTANRGALLKIMEGATQLNEGHGWVSEANNGGTAACQVILIPSAGSHTYRLQGARDGSSGTVTLIASATQPAFILVEGIGT